MDCTKSAFEFGTFYGDREFFAVNKKYSRDEALAICLRENSDMKINPDGPKVGFVHHGFGYDEWIEENRNTWWLDIGENCPKKRCCAVWVFQLYWAG